MQRVAIFIYGLASYLLFFGTFVYLVGFLGDFGVPRSVDHGPEAPLGVAVVVDILLLVVFGLQHSVMARPGFKAWLTRLVPAAAERSTYVLASVAALVLLFWGWRPATATVWSFDDPIARGLLTGLMLGGFGLVFYSTLLIHHFDLFGLRQVFAALRRRPAPELGFVTPSLYRFIRHPLYVGWFIALWATPVMSVGHLILAAGLTGYVLLAIPFEERDLVEGLGEDYARYRAATPRFVPRLVAGSSQPSGLAARPE